MSDPRRDYGPTGCCQGIVACAALLLGGIGWVLLAAARWLW